MGTKGLLPKYTGLKDFAKGVQKLYELHGDLPVFLKVDNTEAPFGLALQTSCSTEEPKDKMVFVGCTEAR